MSGPRMSCCMITGIVFAMRKISKRVLPLLVMVWATFVVLGGALYLAKHGGITEDSAVSAGMGLCAATAAILFGAGVGRPRGRRPENTLVWKATRLRKACPLRYAVCSSPTVSLTRLLLVFRT